MKKYILAFFVLSIVVIQGQLSSCNGKHTVEKSGEGRIKMFYNQQTDSLINLLAAFEDASLNSSPKNLQLLFAKCRFVYKKIEGISEYYFQGLTKRINGPALPDVKTEDGQVWPPHGFQVIEQMLFSAFNATQRESLLTEVNLLKTDLLFMRSNMEFNTINQNHVEEMLQHQFIRVAILGITGFDAPLSGLSLSEAGYSLKGIEQIAHLYYGENKSSSLSKALVYLTTHTDFGDFNRMEFITSYLMPASDLYAKLSHVNVPQDSMMVKPFSGTLSTLMKGNGFNADYYTSYAIAESNAAKIVLGKKLFYDVRLSKSATISCASCHKPDLYFTDGRQQANNFIHGGNLPRNTPTLYYAALQASQFYDVRSTTLEDQIFEVMKNTNEFNFSSAGIAKKLMQDSAYESLFKNAFANVEVGTTGFEVRNAIAAYVRSLSPFSSAFDEYMRGNKNAINNDEIKGFNLFAGKAKCGSCHFMPLFNGNIPPWYNKSESEIIGVPAKAVWKNAVIDPDPGRYNLNKMKELMFAFKTPTIRNIEKTGPYMHNGIYNNLEDVVEFYHKGGGVGIGINLPFQSLPFDSLSLSMNEKKNIVAFMKTLTDKMAP